MDIGLFLCHLLLKAIKFASRQDQYLDLTNAFWRGYKRNATFRPFPELQQQGIEHLGVCLLARVDGTSPVEYLDEDQRTTARKLGCQILQESPTIWDDVQQLLRSP
jgi:5-methylthioribose kinase